MCPEAYPGDHLAESRRPARKASPAFGDASGVLESEMFDRMVASVMTLDVINAATMIAWMIRSFRDKEAERLFLRERRTKIELSLRRVARTKALAAGRGRIIG